MSENENEYGWEVWFCHWLPKERLNELLTLAKNEQLKQPTWLLTKNSENEHQIMKHSRISGYLMQETWLKFG